MGTEYTAVAALMPARFLPGEKILMRATEEKRDTGSERAQRANSKGLPESRVDLDAKEAAELTVIKDFLSSWEKVVW